MSKQFLKKNEVELKNGGYLSNKKGDPIYNGEFVQAQRSAEYIMEFAKVAKGKNFKHAKIDSLSDVKAEVMRAIEAKRTTSFVDKPAEVKRPTHDKLAAEALAFVEFKEDSLKVDKINNFMQQFTVLKDFEEHGLFFESEIVKLNEIYTLEDITKAVSDTIDLLDNI